MNFEQFVGQSSHPTRPKLSLKDTKELALVITAGMLICYELAAKLPEPMLEQALEAIIAQTEKTINEYINHYYDLKISTTPSTSNGAKW